MDPLLRFHYGERDPSPEPSSTHPLIIHLSLKVLGKEAPSMFPRQDLYGERDSVSRANGLSIHICLPESPKKGALLRNGEKHKVTVHGAPRGWKAYIHWSAAWFPKGIVDDSAMQPLA